MRERSVIFLIYWIITLLLYRQACGHQFLDDFLTGAVLFEEQGWGGFKNSYGFTSLYYGHNLLFMGFYDLMGLNKWAWFILFTALHALNATLGYVFFRKLFERHQLGSARITALSGSLLFLTSPYQTENVVWAATLHYGFSMCFLWIGFFLYEHYLVYRKKYSLIALWVLFAYSLVTLEISLVFPGLYAVVFILLWPSAEKEYKWRIHLKYLVSPMAIIIVGYFIATKLIKGHYIGHYGSETHLANLFSWQAAGTYLQYFVKLLAYMHFSPYRIREAIYEYAQQPAVISLCGTLLIITAIWFYKTHSRHIRLSYGLLLLTCICLLPVSNLYFMYLNQVENDRLSYFASFFMYTTVSVTISYLSTNWLRVITAMTICLNIMFLQDYVSRWVGASSIQERAVQTFQWEGARRIFVLNQPCYYRGVYVFRNYTRFIRSMKLFRKINLEGRLIEVAWANMQSLDDDVTVHQTGPLQLSLTLNEWGRWLWYRNRGASDYETDTHAAVFDAWNHSYELRFKTPLFSDDMIIYFTPQGWKTFSFADTAD